MHEEGDQCDASESCPLVHSEACPAEHAISGSSQSTPSVILSSWHPNINAPPVNLLFCVQLQVAAARYSNLEMEPALRCMASYRCKFRRSLHISDRGGRIELRYHQSCFSTHPDPRSQPASSANVGKFVDSLKGTEAPEELYRKMRTRGHW